MSELEDLSERLRKVEVENARLKHTLEVIDREIDHAALRYINSTVPHGKLQFRDFLGLLEAEMRRRYMDERATPEGFRFYVKNTVYNLLLQRAEEALQAMLPQLKGRLQEYVQLPVMVEPARKLGQKGKILKYQAKLIKGVFKPGLGDTPEAAYEDLRERLIVHLKTNGPTALLGRNPMGLAAFKQLRTVMKTEDLEGWQIEVRYRE